MAFRDRNHLLAFLSRATHSGAPQDLAANIKQGFEASSDYKFTLAAGQDCAQQTELQRLWVFTPALLAMALPGCVSRRLWHLPSPARTTSASPASPSATEEHGLLLPHPLVLC